MLGLTGAGVAVAGVGAVSGYVAGASSPPQGVVPPERVVPFRGAYQAGITTPQQDRLHFAALDLTTTNPASVQRVLRNWTAMAERLAAGAETTENGVHPRNPEAPPADTGEASDLPAAALTLTIGFGRSFFDKLGIADRRPEVLEDLPEFTGDRLDPARSNGDICIQACADDQLVAFHAVRNLVRAGFGTTAVRWTQLGFGRTSSTTTTQSTPRNLFGFKDGTNNLKLEEPTQLRDHVWVQDSDGPDWMRNGTYLVARRIRMHLETWDRAPLNEQEAIIGRTKVEGAALGSASEFEPANYVATDANGTPVIPRDSHVRLASAESLNGIRILRRGYNFADGTDAAGHLDAGLFFVCFVRDPGAQFVPMQRALANNDAMMEYIVHTGSGLFACPPGLGDGEYWGQRIFED
jgi:deferrochelatase/peroxidase EfeB